MSFLYLLKVCFAYPTSRTPCSFLKPTLKFLKHNFMKDFFSVSVINEWKQRKIIQKKFKSLTQPSVVGYIAGHRGDDRPVVKVFLQNVDEKDKEFFKSCRSVPEDTQFEFVNLETANQILEKDESITLLERAAFDKTTEQEFNTIIRENAEKIYAKYSTVVGMQIGKVRKMGDTIKEEPCIVLYCLDKRIIPFGEKKLPESIAGWPCVVREEFIMLAACPNHCQPIKYDFPDPGCSIGVPSDSSSGSVGFLFESEDPIKKYKNGFLTASHVAIKHHKELYDSKNILSLHPKPNNVEYNIVHPSWEDNGHVNHKVGEVVESYFGNYGLENIGLDFAVIKTNTFRHEGMYVSRFIQLK